tara:strand:- start:1100 stop:1300 length:201 start_codon:yes stop_codon:yes gene_type:complete
MGFLFCLAFLFFRNRVSLSFALGFLLGSCTHQSKGSKKRDCEKTEKAKKKEKKRGLKYGYLVGFSF